MDIESHSKDYQAHKSRAILLSRLHTKKKNVDRYFRILMLICAVPNLWILLMQITDFTSGPLDYLTQTWFTIPIILCGVGMAYLYKPIACVGATVLYLIVGMGYGDVNWLMTGYCGVGAILSIVAFFFIRIEKELQTHEAYPYFNERFLEDKERREEKRLHPAPDIYERKLPEVTPQPEPAQPTLSAAPRAQMEELILPTQDPNEERKDECDGTEPANQPLGLGSTDTEAREA